ncbi:hypothetical protein SIAM614_04990 [Roseibium aggregatum IAM 12614]|uniref:Uncharacterized protein n=1 Tax=Roseibium aggregatum (strain ATCC 25650 / DSM 13394 / JCM 20685 / NBRC 16684 / NCIMB 2208 / IAM 12614 / B1) TaxID=384765 RepID=A0NSG1_ROSAI|nr:hypothetical protein SIAM614_04990 [Roseibium aggregatum IAM 12614]
MFVELCDCAVYRVLNDLPINVDLTAPPRTK